MRYYDPEAGRFVSRDPLGMWGDPGQRGNAQNYCGNNPVNRVDPMGLDDSASALPGWVAAGTPDSKEFRLPETFGPPENEWRLEHTADPPLCPQGGGKDIKLILYHPEGVNKSLAEQEYASASDVVIVPLRGMIHLKSALERLSNQGFQATSLYLLGHSSQTGVCLGRNDLTPMGWDFVNDEAPPGVDTGAFSYYTTLDLGLALRGVLAPGAEVMSYTCCLAGEELVDTFKMLAAVTGVPWHACDRNVRFPMNGPLVGYPLFLGNIWTAHPHPGGPLDDPTIEEFEQIKLELMSPVPVGRKGGTVPLEPPPLGGFDFGSNPDLFQHPPAELRLGPVR